jgi:hypothetical protein
MPVYFVYRCPYVGPTEKYVRRFEDEAKAVIRATSYRLGAPAPSCESRGLLAGA